MSDTPAANDPTSPASSTTPAGPCTLGTVYDDTREKHHERHAVAFVIHLASWHDHVKPTYPLRVTCITEPPETIRRWIDRFGAEVKVVPGRHPLYDLGPCYNKQLAVPDDAADERVFLTDNDTVYLQQVDDLFALPESAVGVSFAPRARIAPDVWRLLIDEFGARPIETDWTPVATHSEAAMAGQAAMPEKYAYFNGGAVLFPRGTAFWKRWERKCYDLSAFVEQKGMHGRKTIGTDQGSLALSVADHGDWALLPPGYNHFSFHYWNNTVPPAEVRHLHMAGYGRGYGREQDEAKRMSARWVFERFWDEKVRPGMQAHGRTAEEIDAAYAHRDYVLEIVDRYDLEDLRQFA
ncbi:MAG: hypothetical protein AAGK09_07100 [Planctomycetota bacterium]